MKILICVTILSQAELGSAKLQPWAVDISTASRQFCREEDTGMCLERSSIAEAAHAILKFGFVLLANGSLLSEDQMAEGLAVMKSKFGEVKAAAEAQSIDCAPWKYGSRSPQVQRARRTNCSFEYAEAGSYRYDGRMDQTLSVKEGFYSQQPWRNHSSLLDICRKTFGDECFHFYVGGFWNFPGSGYPHWHRDCIDCEYAPELVVVIALEDLPENAGFPLVQPYTHSNGSFSGVNSKTQTREKGEPEPIEVAMKKGDVLIWHFTTKHAASPNLSKNDRALLYYHVGVFDNEDPANLDPEDAKDALLQAGSDEKLPSLLEGLPRRRDHVAEL